MILLLVVAAAATAAGVALERRHGAAFADRAVWVLLYAFGPIVIFPSMATLELDADVGGGLALAWVSMGVLAGLAWLLARVVLRADRRLTGTLIVAGTCANTGYLGIPLCVAVLGTDALGPAIAWDVAVSTPWTLLVGFGIGAAFGTTAGAGWQQRTRSFFTRNPLLWIAVAGLLAPDALAPAWLVDVSHVVALLYLPLGFLVLGAHLDADREPSGDAAGVPVWRAAAIAGGLRLAAMPAVFALLTIPLDVPDAYHLQSFAPSAIMSLVIAHQFGLHAAVAARAVAGSTAVFLVGALVLA